MKKLLISALICLMLPLSSFAEVDLWSPLEQTLPEDVAEKVFLNLEKVVKPEMDLSFKRDIQFDIELKNFYCEISGYKTAHPVYKCSYGMNGDFTGKVAQNIYEALVNAGFESDCDAHDGTCDIDPLKRMTCSRILRRCVGVMFSCTLEI